MCAVLAQPKDGYSARVFTDVIYNNFPWGAMSTQALDGGRYGAVELDAMRLEPLALLSGGTVNSPTLVSCTSSLEWLLLQFQTSFKSTFDSSWKSALSREIPKECPNKRASKNRFAMACVPRSEKIYTYFVWKAKGPKNRSQKEQISEGCIPQKVAKQSKSFPADGAVWITGRRKHTHVYIAKYPQHWRTGRPTGPFPVPYPRIHGTEQCLLSAWFMHAICLARLTGFKMKHTQKLIL